MIKKPELNKLERFINLKSVGPPRISPDGQMVVYTQAKTDWEQNRFCRCLWLSHVDSGETYQLTTGDTDHDARWSPNGKRLAFLRRQQPKNRRKTAPMQIWLISPTGGEATRLTSSETNITSFRWSPDGKTIAYSTPRPATKAMKQRREDYSDFEIVDEDVRMTALWTVAVDTGKSTNRFDKEDKSVSGFSWSPDGRSLALTLVDDPRPKGMVSANIHLLTLKSGRLKPLLDLAGPNQNPVWSPDGKQIAFNTAMGAKYFFYKNTVIGVVSAQGGKPRFLTRRFDEDALISAWKEQGIYFTAIQKTTIHLFCLNPSNSRISRVTQPDRLMAQGFDFDQPGDTVAFLRMHGEHLNDIFVTPVADFAPRQITRMDRQIRGWKKGTTEVVSWRSKDRTEIEGVLFKPADFNPRRKHPLLVVIHGGPTGISLPTLTFNMNVYPIAQWLERGAVVLCPNYRGSAGYGEAFRTLNVRNLGVGDMWDVMSGVSHLVKQGFVNEKRMGAMGWSQGGYISAFLTTNTDRFRAISVGAGISNWMTYYANTDIPEFTRQYLKATPWNDPEVYARTSPMTAIKKANTPTLIQHGERDARVPIPNAYELRLGLEDQGVPVKMVVYKGFGHGLDKPKSIKAGMVHNLEWFDEWLFNA